LTRGSIQFVRILAKNDGLPGQSPAMTDGGRWSGMTFLRIVIPPQLN
jgi:hypothetical protein